MLVKPEDRVITGSLPGEHLSMTFDENSVPHLIELLGKGIYNDPELAVLREYACNARDANDEAGNTAPIEVGLPSTLRPFLTIKDQGIGLDWNDFKNIWSKFGASTKRVEGNTQTGSMGIGSKSGLAYGDQFNVIAIKNGQQYTISVSKTAEGGGDLTLVNVSNTSEANGVEIQIPAKRWNEFAQKATKLFQYWPRGSVLVNGAEIKPVIENDNVQRIADDLYMTQDDYNGTSHIVMANVAYPVQTSEFGVSLPHNRQIIAYVGIDAVDFTGSREALRMTKKTKDTLVALGQRFTAEMQAAMQAEIDKCADPLEAIRCATKWYLATPDAMRPKQWLYKGKEIPTRFAIGEAHKDTGRRPIMTVVRRSSYGRLKDHSREETLPFQTAINAVWFYGYDLKFTSGHRKRIDQWSKEKRANDPNWQYPEHYVLTDAKLVSEYIDPERIVSWEEVRSVKMPNAERADNGRLIGSYDTLTIHDWDSEITAENIDDAEPIYYYVGESNKNLRWTSSRTQRALPYHRLLRTLEPSCTTVLIPETRKAKFLRTFPEAQSVQEACQGLYNEWLDGLSDDEKFVLYLHDSHNDAYSKLKSLDGSRIDDPDLKYHVDLVNSTKISKLLEQLDRYRRVGKESGANSAPLGGSFNNPLVRYPLYNDAYHMSHSDHLYLYLNAAYAHAQAQAAEEVEALVTDELAAVAA